MHFAEIKKIINKQKPLAFVGTYGCQQNVSDSEKIKALLLRMGYSFTKEKKDADLIVFNTCAVRESAELRVLGSIGVLKTLKKRNPKLVIAVCGCMTEQNHIKKKIVDTFPFVDIVIGTNSIFSLKNLIIESSTKNHKKTINSVLQKISTRETDENLSKYREDQTSAFVPIMHGCNNFCSYCIVPYVRGRESSRDPRAIKKEIEDLVENGCKCITLLGQNVNSYGKNLDHPIDFTELLRSITEISGDYWIRFMTSHPKDITKELIDEIAVNDKICKHIHLPFQSGSNRILKKMNRHYTREKYIKIAEYAKEKIPYLSLTSDVIVGFPSETYEDFKRTLSLVKSIRFSSLFTFIYSKRKGTPAADIEDPILHQEKLKWFEELLKIQKDISGEFCSKFVGKTEKILLKEDCQKALRIAKTNQNITVHLHNLQERNIPNGFFEAKLTGHKGQTLIGTLDF
ncbi:MAG: tRNA (N6-isopentenyl adenosine(37)-C2)-methylthiotransferase MiaB [Oscillospiraceae bacterium]|jgi:tRNA-2-methylthio-N6-dimethylallyladenosine synthase|nr:tRNA (N6-isopentenyl adenosine(37)-C2)-methylthiotransferase MiaB [Oscillospiraceae bacterium]